MGCAIAQQVVTDAPARHVLLCLSNYAGVDGAGAFPSAATLALDTGLSERTVRAKLDLLEASGLIRRGNQAIVAAWVERADRRPVVYDVVLPGLERGAAGAPRKAVDKSVDKSGNGVQLPHERGAGAAPKPRALTVKLLEPDVKAAKQRHRAAEGAGLRAVQNLLRGVDA